MRLEFRLTLWLLAFVGTGAFISVTEIGRLEERTLEEQSEQAGHQVATAVKSSLELSMLHNARDELAGIMDNLQGRASVQSVAVYGRQGDVWTATSQTKRLGHDQGAALTEAVETRLPVSATAGETLTVFVPVENQARCQTCHRDQSAILGAVGVSLDEHSLRHDLAETSRRGLLVGSVPLLLGLIVWLVAVRRRLIHPLAMLGAAAERVGRGDFGAELPPLPGKEFGAVGHTFNQMSERLRRRANDLVQTVLHLREDLRSMAELQSLLASGAGPDEMLTRTVDQLGTSLGASGVAVWAPEASASEAEWGERLPAAAVRLARAGEWPKCEARASLGRGPSKGLEKIPIDSTIAWLVLPPARSGRCVARVAMAWKSPVALSRDQRELGRSLATLIAVALENDELLGRLGQQERSLHALLEATVEAREEERKRIARELHDETSQILHALFRNAELLESHVSASDPLKSRLGAMKALAEEAGRNLDKVMVDLRPALLDELGLVPALRWYVTQVRDAWDVPISLRVDGVERLPESLEMAAFRIAQEAVSNAVRHAHAEHIAVDLAVHGAMLGIEVRDDGVGFDPDEVAERARTGDGTGLVGARERTALLGGDLVVTSLPGGGTTVRADLPLPDPSLEAPNDGQDQGARGRRPRPRTPRHPARPRG